MKVPTLPILSWTWRAKVDGETISPGVLLELRPDYIKIDKILIQGVHADTDKDVVVGKLIEMAKHFNMRTIAEGIETQAEADWAKERGVDYVQGYFFARPAVPPPDT